MELISVIVPVFKVDPYLDRCVESIVNQTYRNLEIILVDDGSPDSCGAMCDAWAEKDRRIKVIHKKNGGLSDARNAGLDIATGTLIGFVDSDDFIRSDMYLLLMERLMEDGSDIAACGVEMVFEDGTPSRMLTPSGKCVLSTEAAMIAVIEESWLKQPVWNKLYRTELIRDIPFPVGKYHEDVFWTYKAVGSAKQVSVFDTPCYYYCQRSGSIMGESYSLRRLDILPAKRQRLEYLKENFPVLENLARVDLIFSCMYAMQMSLCYLPQKDLRTARKLILDLWNQNKGPIECAFTQRIWHTLACISFEGTCRLRNFLGVGT